jgi:hypothetical protein
MHEQCFRYVAKVVAELDPAPRTVVDIGGLNINGTVRGLFPGAEYTSVDLRPGPGVDVVADGATWRPAGLVDCVVCTEVLEHAPDPGAIVANAIAMLREGGTLIVTAAMEPRTPHSAIHGGPLTPGEHYANVDPVLLMEWIQAGCIDWRVETDERHGDVRAVGVR